MRIDKAGKAFLTEMLTVEEVQQPYAQTVTTETEVRLFADLPQPKAEALGIPQRGRPREK